ncbi:uncharacterized protein A1O9_02977 [Exophiala aquamarina CBS 119918]|uniref:C2H2-type domain-containing protein n=1 Tax=Exophiala aquamarina CBS 119918 TaxID=1182545 RepID=A0A072PNF1_9EURO|nr:uncharacterized protein A1O9_02977 [Exophiala aquamarina CBS 119918]KEF61411.1 hypothetical protein A1O9_02977 [Exophiala aquamarina CBS 119918]
MAKRSRDSSIISSDDDGQGQIDSIDESESPRPTKLSAIAMTDSPEPTAIQCSLPPHREPLSFSNAEAFEVHYVKEHSNRCSACGKNFPTAHFLALHTDENHNTFREALQAKGEKTYACFVQGCEKMCSTPQKRRLHLIDKHLFPKIYNFRVVDTGVDRSTSMLHEGRRRRVSTLSDQPQSSGHQRKEARPGANQMKHSSPVQPSEGDPYVSAKSIGKVQDCNRKPVEGVSDTTMNELERSMSSLRFVPPSIANKVRNKQKQR